MMGTKVKKILFFKMSGNQNTSSITPMDVDNSTSQVLVKNKTLTPLPNQVLETLTIIQKYLSRQENYQEIKITRENIFANETLIYVNYEACKICKKQHGSLACSTCERKICSACIVKRAKITQCVKCKEVEKLKAKINSEFDEKIEKLLILENGDKVREVIQVEVENLGGKDLEELIDVVRKLEKKGEKFDREVSIAHFYVGKIFYERMEEFFSKDDLVGEQKVRKILASFRQAKDLEFGGEKMSVEEIREKLGIDDKKISRFFNLNLRIYLTYKDFESAEEQIRRAERILAVGWLRDLSQEKFIDFWVKLSQKRKEFLLN